MSGRRLRSLTRPVLVSWGWLAVVLLVGACGWIPVPKAPTEVPPPTPLPTATPPPGPTATVPSVPEEPTPNPTATHTPEPDEPYAEFVSDVSVPDGTEFPPGKLFTKVWRIRSTGSVPWPEGSRLAFVSGDQMGAPASVPVPKTAVGSTADVSADMQAPAKPGTYKGVWQMEDKDGNRFGDQIFVVIVVPEPVAPPSVSFVADKYLITTGECVTISWLAENVKAVYYQSSATTGSGSRVECPTSTTLYELRVQYPNETWESFYITITVKPGY
jgi:putative transposon-encoded protein